VAALPKKSSARTTRTGSRRKSAPSSRRRKKPPSRINKDDRKLFKDLFWMRRDFNPVTSENEYQKDYMAREGRGREFPRGWNEGLRERHGKIFLLLGGPNQQQRGGKPGSDAGPQPGAAPGSVGEDPASESGVGSLGGDEEGAQAMTWVYDPNPALGIPNGISVPFRQQAGFGFRMVPSDELTKQLERVKERLVANPSVNYARDESGRLRKADMKFDPNSPAKLASRPFRKRGRRAKPSLRGEPLFLPREAGRSTSLDFVLAPASTRPRPWCSDPW
jgi:GWxTD domain-containing protein